MQRLTSYAGFEDAQKHFSRERLREVFDGREAALHIAHACVDRPVGTGMSITIVSRDGADVTSTRPVGE